MTEIDGTVTKAQQWVLTTLEFAHSPGDITESAMLEGVLYD